MSSSAYVSLPAPRKYSDVATDDRVNEVFPSTMSAGLTALLAAIPDEADALDLEDAVAIVGRHATNPYAAIAVAMGRGLVTAEHLDLPDVDKPIVIRRR